MACPKPVLEAKKALETLEVGDFLELIVDNKAAKENVSRFVANSGFVPEVCELGGELFKISVKIDKKNSKVLALDEVGQVLFLKSDKIGEGELGSLLMQGFLSNILELSNKPELIICVNTAVLIGSDASHPAHEAMKALEKSGIELVSCSACLDYFAKEAILGEVGNAYSILAELFSTKKVLSL